MPSIDSLVVRRAGSVTLLVGIVGTVIGGIVAGTPGAIGGALGTVIVLVDTRTQLDGDEDDESLALGDITSGDFLEVEANPIGNTLVASYVRRRDETDEDTLQGWVDSFNTGVDITVLGVTFSTVGAQFEDGDDGTISAEAFFAQVQVGDLVKIEDDELADGIADKVEFEGDALDDGSDDDDDQDDDSDDDSEDDSDGDD